MAFLLHMSFSNTRRLQRRTYLFEYKGVRFKLIQTSPKKWADHLLTIVPSYNSAERLSAFAVGSEFLSALAWELGGAVAVWESGGSGCPDGQVLRNARPTIRSLPRIGPHSSIAGYELTQIPHIKTEAQRVALALFREARASNNDYLSFLFFWQVLTVGRGVPENLVDQALRKHREELRFDISYLDRLPLRNRTLGAYLRADCRDAIAHFRRSPGEKIIDLDRPDERSRLAVSSRVVEGFAEHHLRTRLGLSDKLYLLRPRGGGFPTFMVYPEVSRRGYVVAYPRIAPRQGITTRPRR